MTEGTSNPVTIDGISLDTYAWNIDSKIREWAPLRSSDEELAGIDGDVHSLGDDYGASLYEMSMWLQGSDENGVIPSGVAELAQLRSNLDHLSFLFRKRHALIDLREVVEPVGPNLLHPDSASADNGIGAFETYTPTSSTLAAESTIKDSGTGSIKVTYQHATEDAQVMASGTLPYRTFVVGGQVYTASVAVRAAQAINGYAFISFFTSGGSFISHNAGPQSAAPVGAFSRYYITVTAPSNAAFAVSGWQAAARTVGDIVYLDTFSLRTGIETAASPGGPQRQALCKVIDSIKPEIKSRRLARFNVTLKIPSGAFQDVSTSDWASTPTIVSGNFYEITTLRGSSAPISDAVIYVVGPITNPRFTDWATGAWVQLNKVLAAGERWRVNNETWTTHYGPTATITSGTGPLGAPDNVGTQADGITDSGGGNARLLKLEPKLDSGVRKVMISLTGTGITSATMMEVRARKKFFQ